MDAKHLHDGFERSKNEKIQTGIDFSPTLKFIIYEIGGMADEDESSMRSNRTDRPHRPLLY